MKKTPRNKNPYALTIYRPFWITISFLLIILTVALTILINASWRAYHRTEPLKVHMALIEDIRYFSSELGNIFTNREDSLSPEKMQRVDNLYQELTDLLNQSKILSDEARLPLLKVAKSLQNIKTKQKNDIDLIKQNIQQALHIEVGVQNNLLYLLARDSRLELETTTSIAVTLPVLGILMLFFLRHRILRPLDNLSLLISRVGRQSLPKISLDDIDPLLKPLFVDFSQLIERLADLEKTQLKHQQELENKVRNATQSLLEYQQTLAQSERLAAVGELTAGLAHELRNPLAGIHLALVNLRNEISDEEKNERLTLVIDELNRVTKLLNQVLLQSRHTPEPATEFRLVKMLDSLLQLLRYQIPDNIKITHTVADSLICHLPQGALKQALLNIILNSVQSIGEDDGSIIISAEFNEKDFVIKTCDTGQGFSKKMLDNGVQPFATGKENGTGLGLAIVRRFCFDLGGQLFILNQQTGGACVKIILPRELVK